MKLSKIKLSTDASNRLKQLQSKTGLRPNILSRLALCHSLSEPGTPDPGLYPEEDREFNRYTLLGEWDALYVGLLRQRLLNDGLPQEHLEDHFRSHLHRGIESLAKIVKSLPDLLVVSARSA